MHAVRCWSAGAGDATIAPGLTVSVCRCGLCCGSRASSCVPCCAGCVCVYACDHLLNGWPSEQTLCCAVLCRAVLCSAACGLLPVCACLFVCIHACLSMRSVLLCGYALCIIVFIMLVRCIACVAAGAYVRGYARGVTCDVSRRLVMGWTRQNSSNRCVRSLAKRRTRLRPSCSGFVWTHAAPSTVRE